MTAPQPDEATLRDYFHGRLPTVVFAEVDAWLAEQDEDTVVTLAECLAEDQPRRLPTAEAPPAELYRSAGTQRFDQVAALADGGMGHIDVVHDTMLDRAVVLKRCHPRAPEEPLQHQRQRRHVFRREALLTARLEHPAIIPVHDFGQDAFGEPTMVLKHLQGSALDRYAQPHLGDRRWALTEGLDIVIRLAEAIAYAHNAGVVHRDLKPENIVIGNFGAVTVIDWGLAAACHGSGPLAEDPAPGQISGTPDWMAPEQASGSLADPRMDVWALGGLLGYVFTGTPPRTLPQAAITALAATIAKPITWPDDAFARIPAALRAVASRCLQHDPAQRYADANEVLGELRRWRNQGITAAQQPGWWQRGWAGIQRHRTAVLLSAAVSLAFAVLILSQVHNHRQNLAFAAGAANELVETTEVLDAGAVATALHQIRALRAQYGDLPAITTAREHFTRIAQQLAEQRALDQLTAHLAAVERQARLVGPSRNQISERLAILREAGIDLSAMPAIDPVDDGISTNPVISTLATHPLSDALLGNLAALDALCLIYDRGQQLHQPGQHEQILRILNTAKPGSVWTKLATVLAAAHVQAHDVHVPNANAAAATAALDEPVISDVLLPLVAPGPQLLAHAEERIRSDPSAFWPHIVLGRHALLTGETANARRHAHIALGREGHSALPWLLLAYVGLRENDQSTLAEALTHLHPAHAEDPDLHLEVAILRAAAQAQAGELATAQATIDEIEAWAHFTLHDHVHSPHPMDLALTILRAHQVRLTPPTKP